MSDSKLISIAEKVKFWEEQDQINKSLIPRVIKSHEMLKNLSEKLSEFTNALFKNEAKLVGNIKSVENMEKEIEAISKKQGELETGLNLTKYNYNSIKDETKNLLICINTLDEKIENLIKEIDSYKANISDQNQNESKTHRYLTYLAVVLSIIATLMNLL